MTEEQAREDFIKRIENYKSQYEPLGKSKNASIQYYITYILDEELDDELSFIKVINAGRSFFVHNVNGYVLWMFRTPNIPESFESEHLWKRPKKI